MPAMCIALALAIVVVAAIAIVKKLDVRIVLLVAGMALNILALAFGAENILPKGAQSTGLVFFDLFEAFDALSLKQITGTASSCSWLAALPPIWVKSAPPIN